MDHFLSHKKTKILMAFTVILSLMLTGAASASPSLDTNIIAYDMVGSASQNLTSFVNNAPAFSSAGDCFGKYQRAVSSSIPYDVLDDSLVSFPPDSQGIIDDNNLDEFFCIVDTENGDNSGPVTAVWTFDISGADNLELSVDIGAMGDFEAADVFTIEAAIDGGAAETIFTNTVDEDISQDYTLAGGATFTLNDPMLVDGVLLNNILQTFSKALTGSGSELVLTLTAQTNGGGEAIAFQNLIISGTPAGPQMIAYDMVGSASQNLTSFVNNAPTFSSAGDCFGKYQRAVSSSIPYDVLDDSLVSFPPDSQGIIDDNNLDEFFCIVDTENGDNSGPVTAVWTFDISGADNLELSVDIGAMGDFEAADVFIIEAAIDGGAAETIFTNTVDEDISQDYTLAGGATFTLNDPMLVDGVLLNNILQTFSKALTGSGSELVLTLTAQTNGGGEAIAFQNLIISGGGGGGETGPEVGDLVINEIMQNPYAVYDSAGEWFELYNQSAADIDINGWTIADNGSDSHVIDNGGPLLVPAGGYLVLGNNADSATNGGVPVAYSYSSWYLSNSDDEVVLSDPDGVEFDRVEYDGGPVFPDPNGASMSLSDPAMDNNDGVYWCTSTTPFGDGDLGTPGAENNCPPYKEAKIHEVQGSGESVAMTVPVLLEAVVVGDFQEDDQLDGFFIQEEDADVDYNANTSEGIFVYCGWCDTDVAVGDLVEVAGNPGEYFGMSQISSDTVVVLSSGNPLPTPAVIDLPAAGSSEAEATFENVEGMLVTFTDTLYVSEYYELARYSQLVLTADARPQQFTDAFEPDVDGYAAFLDDLNSKRIILDDDNNIQNDAIGTVDEPYFWPRPGLSNDNYVRGGDSITNLTGVLHWSYAGQSGTDAWRVRPVDGFFDYDFTSNNARTEMPDAVGGGLKVASFNVLNYFTTIDSRGADSTAELDRQRAKIASAICAMDADIVGLIEIENNNPVAISDLLDGPNGINENCGPYAFVETGEIGTDEIAVAFIYKTATTETVGDFAILDSSVDERFVDTKNRPALAQTFMDSDTGGILTVVVNHLKSKGSDCDDLEDPDLFDGAGNCNLTRTDAAEAMVDWLATDPTGSGDNDFLIIGDLNSYRNETPIDALKDGGYTDLLDYFYGASAYSYVFDGQLGYLDYALAGSGLFDEVTGVTAWHINADEIPVFDYNDDIQDSGEASYERESSSLPIYEPNAYRASDHDPVLVGLDVCDEIAPVFDELTVTPDSLWPANHKYVDITATVVVSDNFDANPVVELVSVESNEPDDGLGDGDTADDIVIVNDYTFMLRAERSGTGEGRVYTITYKVTDACGNSTMQSVTVTVPLNQGKKK